MARLSRLTLPGLPHHVVWRAVGGLQAFRDAQDYQTFLEILLMQLRVHALDLHAYVLLDDRIHLLLTPQQESSLSRLMQGIGRRYVRYFNERHNRYGTLWDGRFRAGPLQPLYVLDVMVFMDELPVRAQCAPEPQAWVWSSHRHFAGLAGATESDVLVRSRALSAHAAYWALADTPFGRESAYRARVQQGLEGAQARRIEASAMGGWLLGEADFVRRVAEQAGERARRLVPGKRGRPPKTRAG